MRVLVMYQKHKRIRHIAGILRAKFTPSRARFRPCGLLATNTCASKVFQNEYVYPGKCSSSDVFIMQLVKTVITSEFVPALIFTVILCYKPPKIFQVLFCHGKVSFPFPQINFPIAMLNHIVCL